MFYEFEKGQLYPIIMNLDTGVQIITATNPGLFILIFLNKSIIINIILN